MKDCNHAIGISGVKIGDQLGGAIQMTFWMRKPGEILEQTKRHETLSASSLKVDCCWSVHPEQNPK